MTDLMTHPSTPKTTGVADALLKSGLFAALPEALLRDVAVRSTMRTVRRGERLWEHGAPCTAIGIVASGRVKCWSPGHDSRQWVSSVVRPGGVCGLAACIDGGPYTCNAEPLERSRVVLVPQSALRAAMEREPAFARRVAVTLAGDVRRVLSVCEDVALHTPLERLAHYLRTQQTPASSVVELHETQTQIAAQLGTVREVVGRGFRNLEAQGIVARTGRVVRILRLRELAEIAKGP
jgi:CRP/FNR family cyclic AMP-dependent transcriptional regulator